MRAPLTRAFAGRRVLVTGDTGFKGSWLCELLTELGAHVFGYALPHTTGVPVLIRHRDGDVRDAAGLTAYVREIAPDFVFHLAAQAIVSAAYADPKGTFDTNVLGTVNVLEAVRACPSVQALVHVSSDKVYGPGDLKTPHSEGDPLEGRDPYSASKVAAERVVVQYRASSNHPRVAIARACNAIGGGDRGADRLVPDCVRALEADHPIPLRQQAFRRTWLHVLDLLHGYLLLAATPIDALNFGADDDHSAGEVAELVTKRWGSGTIVSAPSTLSEAPRLLLDSSLAHAALGWRPRWDFERAVVETVAWYRAVHDGADARAITQGQIRAFLES